MRTLGLRQGLTMAALALVALAVPATAHADSWDVSGGSGNSGDSSGIQGGVTAGWGCHPVTKAQTYKGQIMSLPNWPKCVDASYDAASMGNCPTGWFVWRFYGVHTGAIKAQSISYIRFDQEPFHCKGPVVRVYNPHPSDNSGTYTGKGTAWSQSFGTNVHGQRYTRSEGGRFTTEPPVWRNANTGVGCRSMQNKNMETALAHPTVGQEYRNFLGNLYTQKMEQKQGHLTSHTWTNTKGTPTKDASGNWSIQYHDGINCSSPFDFAAWETDPKDKQVVTATCAIPVTRITSAYTKNGKNVQGYKLKYAESVSKALGPQPEGKDYIAKFRAAMGYQIEAGIVPDNVLPQHAYASPLSSNKPNRTLDRKQLSAELKKYAVCFKSPQVVLTSLPKGDSVEEKTGGGVVGNGDIVIRTPQAFQSGGVHRRTSNTVVATPSGFTCSLPECKLTRYDYTFEVLAGSSTLKQCHSSSSTNCDYHVVSKTGPHGAEGSTTYVLDFLRATNPGEKYRVRVSGAYGEYQYSYTNTRTVTVICPDGDPNCVASSKTTTTKHWATGSFTPNIVGNPVALTGSSSGSGWIDLPVIGANPR